MTQRIILNQQPVQTAVQPAAPYPSPTAVAVASSTDRQIAQTWPFNCVVHVSPVVTIPAPVYFGADSPLQRLAKLINIGRQYHPRAPRGHYVWQRPLDMRGRDYYMGLLGDNRPLHTCAIAAAFAGAFGPGVIGAGFSASEARKRLDRHVGYDLDQLLVIGPTGRQATVYDQIVFLSDVDGWSRAGIGEHVPLFEIVN